MEKYESPMINRIDLIIDTGRYDNGIHWVKAYHKPTGKGTYSEDKSQLKAYEKAIKAIEDKIRKPKNYMQELLYKYGRSKGIQ